MKFPTALLPLFLFFFLQNQQAEAVHPAVVPLITTLVAVIKNSIDIFASVTRREHGVNMPLTSVEDFNTNYGDNTYLLRSDYKKIRPKIVALNEGLQEIGSSVDSLEEDMEEGFRQVCSFKS